jgi:hypothetical protein
MFVDTWEGASLIWGPGAAAPLAPLQDRPCQRGGSELEPIKILLKNSAYQTKITRRLPTLLFRNPRSH